MVLTRVKNSSGNQSGFYSSDAPLAKTGLGVGVRVDSADTPVWRFDGNVSAPSNYRQDNNGGIIPPYKLTHIINKVFEQRFAPYKAAELFPVNRDGGWNDFIEHYSMSSTGRAAVVCCANDFPRVNISGQSFKTPSVTLGTGYEVCYSDLQKATTAGFGLVERLTAAAKRALEMTLNRLAFEGDSNAGILGIANNPLLGMQASPIRLDDPLADPLLILQVMQRAARTGYVSSGMANPMPDTLALPPSIAASIGSRPIGTLNPVTIQSMFLQSGAVKRIVEVPELEFAGPGRSRMALFYRANAESVEWRVPGMIETLPPFWNGYGYEVNLISRINSLWFYYPEEVVKLVGI